MILETIEEANHKRYLFAILEFSFRYLIPVAILGSEYQLFSLNSYNKIKLSIAGAILFVVLLLVLKDWLLRWISTWEIGFVRSLIDVIINYIPIIAITGLLLVAQQRLDDFLYNVWLWIGISYFIGLLFKQPHEKWLTYVVEKRRIKNYG